MIIGYKGIENGHECFSAFRYTETSGKERFGGDFEESEWCDCYALDSANLDKDIDAQPDVMSVFSKKSIKVRICNAFFLKKKLPHLETGQTNSFLGCVGGGARPGGMPSFHCRSGL